MIQAPAICKTTEKTFIAETRFFPDLNLTQIIMKNGMSVWLKPTDFESNEVLIKLSSTGGFASLSPDERPSGELAADIAWESGMGDLTSDQMTVLLYEHSLDFVVKIGAFNRIIEGNACRRGVKEFLSCVNRVFTQSKLTEKGLNAALENTKRQLSKVNCDHEQVYENTFRQVNTQGFSPLRPLFLDHLIKVDINKSRKFFDDCFSSPEEFVCVIVGCFNLAKMESLVNKYLGAIPEKHPPQIFDHEFSVVFPKGITRKTINLAGRADCLTRVTFPLLTKLDDSNIPAMEFMCQIIEARLRRVITKKMKLSHGVDVSYEFPLYPLLDSPWISIHYRSDFKHVEELSDLILMELKKLQEEGSVEKEMQEIKTLQTGSEEFWLRDNFYWVSMLTNYYLWDWTLQQVLKAQDNIRTLGVEEINFMLKNYFSLENYSIVTGKPSDK